MINFKQLNAVCQLTITVVVTKSWIGKYLTITNYKIKCKIKINNNNSFFNRFKYKITQFNKNVK